MNLHKRESACGFHFFLNAQIARLRHIRRSDIGMGKRLIFLDTGALPIQVIDLRFFMSNQMYIVGGFVLRRAKAIIIMRQLR